MLADKKQKKLIYWSFLSLFIYAVLFEMGKAEISMSAANFFILIYISIGFLIALGVKTGWKQDMPSNAFTVYSVLFVCNIIAIARGLYFANGYNDWKNMTIDPTGGLSLLIPLAMIAGLNFLNARPLIKLCITILTFSFLYVPIFINYSNEIYSRLVTPVVFLILFIPYFRLKQRFIIITVAIVSAYVALTLRVNVLHIGLSVLFILIYYFRKWITTGLLFTIQILFFVVPFFYLYQGINGNNIFSKSENTEIMVTSKTGEENFTGDTRTPLYEEVLKDLTSTRTIWLGKGANGKYKTEYDWELLDGNGDERGNVEVGFLKTLMQTGIAGFVLYTIVLGMAVYYGTSKTRNSLTKIIATFLASHWAILFLENAIDYNMYFYFSWLAAGICFSKKMRSLDDNQIKEWIRYGK